MQRRVRVQCNNCTCSPGLLSRTNRRSSLIARQINLKRNESFSGSRPGSRKGSVFTIDVSTLCPPETTEVNTSKRLEKLREQMAEYDLGVYIIPSEDEHQSEYVGAFDQKRGFISGFQGSAGIAIVTRDVTCMNPTPEGLAALSTDGRYFTQALNEIDFNWTLLKQGVSGDPTWEEWAVQQAIQLSVDSGSKINIGVDPKLISYSLYEKIDKLVSSNLAKNSKAEVELVPIRDNLVAKIWDQFEKVPPPPSNIIKVLDIKYAGEEIGSKLEKVAKQIENSGGDSLIVSSLDEIAWLLNMRGSDIPYNPVFYSYLIIDKDKQVQLFADHYRFDTKVQSVLQESGVKVHPYESFWDILFSMAKDYNLNAKKFLVPSTVSWEIVRTLKCSYERLVRSPIEDLKSIKNKTELEGAKSAHLKDGKALVKFFSWLENQLICHDAMIDEIEADNKLTELRQHDKEFVGLSFSTISASGANASIIHYKPVLGACAQIDPDKIYLNDSGSQFLCGTTDVTRSVHFGTPKPEEIRNYTLVLKGHIALASLKFPEKTAGSLIDAIARQFLWNHGLDYRHGTSHGVGSFLNVHEGPIGIGPRPNAATSYLKEGHLISNEPGYYEDGEYGIRIENVMFVKDSGESYNGKKFLEFETITRVPFCKRLIDVSLLTPEEKAWINNYHEQVWNDLSDMLAKRSVEWNWLRRETTAI